MSKAGRNIVIVGAGPVGLTAAVALSDLGLPVTVLETSPIPQTDWRASTFHAATLELLERIDVVDEMLARGLIVRRFQHRDRRLGPVAEFDFASIASDTRHPYRLQLNQQVLVCILLDKLRGRDNVDLRFGTRVRDLACVDDHVELTIESAGEPQTLAASYVVGADGPSSTVRRSMAVSFDGMTYPQRFLIASVSECLDDLIPGIAPVAYISDPDEWLFLLRTPESWRVVMPVTGGEQDTTVMQPDSVLRRLSSVAEAPGGYHLIETQVYRVHQRVAADFRRGRLMIIGDAAHINSPLGGMGLNSGIHDAIDLAMRLERIWTVGDQIADSELATFAEQRRRIALDFIRADTHRNTVMMQERDEVARSGIRAELRATAADPARARQWLMRASLLAAVREHGIGLPPEHIKV